MKSVIGVCSWSLQPVSPAELAGKVRSAELNAVQIALDPLDAEPGWSLDDTVATLREHGVEIRSGMLRTRGEDYSTLDSIRRTGGLRLDENWHANIANAERCASLAKRLGIDLVSFHAGFLPPHRSDPLRDVMISRLRAVIDALAAHGIRTAFETGQETADTLLDCLAQLERSNAGVNFDPANMILYNHGDPIESLRKLAPHVFQVHIKDAIRTKTPGTWGAEVPVGEGDVDWAAFFGVLRDRGVLCDLMIEREAGGRRLEEIAAAARLISRYR